MEKNKFDIGKMRENFSGVERFAHRYMIETLTVAAVVVGALSAWMHLFLGTLGWSMLFIVIGSVLGVFFPVKMDMVMKRVYSFSNGRGSVMMYVGEGVKILVALFLPFLYFGFLGIMTGTAYKYYIRHSQSGSKGSKAA